jgi:hypothetical protein
MDLAPADQRVRERRDRVRVGHAGIERQFALGALLVVHGQQVAAAEREQQPGPAAGSRESVGTIQARSSTGESAVADAGAGALAETREAGETVAGQRTVRRTGSARGSEPRGSASARASATTGPAPARSSSAGSAAKGWRDARPGSSADEPVMTGAARRRRRSDDRRRSSTRAAPAPGDRAHECLRTLGVLGPQLPQAGLAELRVQDVHRSL